MSKQLTLIVILESQLVRIDIASRRQLQVNEIWRRDRIESESLAGLTDSALRLGPKKTGDVWVLCADFWTGVVPLAPDAAGMLSSEELEQALTLEAEDYSGIPAFESKIGTRKLPPDNNGDHRWWVTQIPTSQWQDVQRTVTQFGGKWGGMAHPAIARLPGELAQNDQTWRVIQSFGDTTVAVLGCGTGVVDVLSLGNISTQRTRSQLADWTEDTRVEGETLSWISDGFLPEDLNAPDDWHLDLSSEVARSGNLHTNWALAAAAGVMAKQDDEANKLPGVAAETPPMSDRRAIAISTVLAVMVAVGCFVLHKAVGKNLSAVTAQVDQFEQQRQTLAADKKSQSALEERVEELQKQLTALRSRNDRFEQDLEQATRMQQFGRNRWPKMLTALSESYTGDCWVREIKSDQQSATVHGVAVVAGDVTVFASRLEQLASPHGWRVHPARTERNAQSLIQFEIKMEVTDQVPKVKRSLATDSKLVKK
ncbi:MAG: hypothetical protein CMJ78_23365 [Planctomycetaceae bacterium]|nr:hypothetical protein [Planctomycetaceae bacterium]